MKASQKTLSRVIKEALFNIHKLLSGDTVVEISRGLFLNRIKDNRINLQTHAFAYLNYYLVKMAFDLHSILPQSQSV